MDGASINLRIGQHRLLRTLLLAGGIAGVALLGWQMRGLLLTPPSISPSIQPVTSHIPATKPVENEFQYSDTAPVSQTAKATPAPVPSEYEAARVTLLKRGYPVDAAGYFRAIRQDSAPDVQAFVRAGFSVAESNSEGRSALGAALESGAQRAAEQLLTLGVDPNAADPDGKLPLQVAVAATGLSGLEMLLHHGVNLNARSPLGETALGTAITTKQLDAAKFLISNGAQLLAADEAGLISQALETEDPKTIRFTLGLVHNGQSWTESARQWLFTGIRLRDSETVRLMFQKFSATPSLAENSQPLLAYAVAWGDVQQCQFLLDCGMAPDPRLRAPAEPRFMRLLQGEVLRHYAETESGMTPLMVAAAMGRSDLVQMLLQHGARPGCVTEKYKLAAIIFSAKARDTRSTLLLLGRSPTDANLDHIEISLAAQTAKVYIGGAFRMTTEVSTGRPGFETKPGEYVLTDKHLQHMSTIYKVKMPFFMRLSCADFGMHEGYVPGYPDSHGCIRLPPSAARTLYKELPIGTVVRVW